MRPTLRQLQYLVAIADTGKFGLAAQQLNVSQPSLSTMISDMETELGVILVERGKQGALLTPVGEEITARARMILSEVGDLKTLAAQHGGILSGRLRLAVLPSIGPYLLPNATRTLHERYPQLRLIVREEKTVNLDTLLREGRIDAIISSTSDHSGTMNMPLFTEDLFICVAPDHALAGSSGEVRLSELEGQELLSLGNGFGLNVIASEIAARAGGILSSEYEGTSLDAIRQMAAMGAGVAILPRLYATTEARRDPDLIIRRIDDSGARREISLIWRETSALRDSLEKLGTILREEANKILNRDTLR